MNYVVEIASCGKTNKPNIMKTGTDVQAILRHCLHSMRRCNVGIADGIDL
jgi:hypothetical protein